jgi:hypothetical protein
MKASRFYLIMLIAVLAFSSLAASPVYPSAAGTHASAGAKSSGAWVKKAKIGSLVVNNRTGGSLYVKLSGEKTYFFVATSQGKTTFNNIVPGKYTITVTASACGGSLVYTKKISGKASLKPVVCR